MSTNKPKLIILRGLPASGKTTWATAWVAQDRPHRVRVNKDDLRKMIDNGVYVGGSLGTEARIIAARDALVQKLMERGLNIVVDDTNLAKHHVKKLMKIAHAACWEYEVRDFPVDMMEAITRDLGRPYPVGYHVIEEMYNKYIKNHKGEFPPLPTEAELASVVEGDLYIPAPDTPAAAIIDIDGTVALRGTRDPFDETRVAEDQPNTSVIEAIQADLHCNALVPVFMSGRTEGCYVETHNWLTANMYLPDNFDLFMRPVGDHRPDNEVKLEMFNKLVRYNYNIRRVYDDRNQVVKMWRSLGLPVLQVADGNF